MWQCFLTGARNRLRHQYVHGGSVDVIGVDAAKLACCFRAATARCRQLCQQVLYEYITFTCVMSCSANRCDNALLLISSQTQTSSFFRSVRIFVHFFRRAF